MTWFPGQSQNNGWWQASDGQWYPPEQRGPAPIQTGPVIGQRIRHEEQWTTSLSPNQVRDELLARVNSVGGTITNVEPAGFSARLGAAIWYRWLSLDRWPKALRVTVTEDSIGSLVTVTTEDALPVVQQVTLRFTIRNSYERALNELCWWLRSGIANDSSHRQPGQTPPVRWYPDPEDSRRSRYWDGQQWTMHTSWEFGN